MAGTSSAGASSAEASSAVASSAGASAGAASSAKVDSFSGVSDPSSEGDSLPSDSALAFNSSASLTAFASFLESLLESLFSNNFSSSSGDNSACIFRFKTFSEGCAPFDTQYSYLSRLNLKRSSLPLADGLKKPSLSINLPSRGFLESATVIKKYGAFFAPLFASRITTMFINYLKFGVF